MNGNNNTVNIFKFDLSDEILERLDYDIKGYEMIHGLIVRTLDRVDASDLCRTLPITLHPSPFPRKIFQQALDIQLAMNELQFRVSIDKEFLCDALADVAKNDVFTRKFLDIYKKVMDEGLAQNFICQLQRSDYMCHNEGDGRLCLKQIEVNTFAAGGMAWAGNLTELHRRTMRKLGVSSDEIRANMPPNDSIRSTCEALKAAWQCYGRIAGIVLMVTEQDDCVATEFWLIERLLKENIIDTIRVEKISLRLHSDRLTLDEETKTLYLDGTKEVAVIYYMGAGDEKDFASQTDWDALLRMERSRAVKCPFIGIQMADNKKVQQVLTKPGVLERFFPHDPATVAALRGTFVGQWGLDDNCDPETGLIMEWAQRDPDRFVLKSNREGGHGLNYFGPAIAEQLREMEPEKLSTYVLMERINAAPVSENYILRPLQSIARQTCNSELGVFGYLLADVRSRLILENRCGGYILKTKPVDVNEAGIAKGQGALDTAFLID